MRARRMLCLLPALLMPIGLPGPAEGQNGHSGAAGEVWPGHAAPDEAVAREGRAAMPFTAEQIEALGRLLRETQAAASVAADVVPEGRIRRVRIGSPGEGAIPAIAVRKGYVTAVSFTDATGAPWPVEEVLVDARFLAQTAGSEGAGRRDRRCGEPPSLPGTAGSIPSRQRGGQAAWRGRTAGGDASGRRRGGRTSGSR